jgi:hypothetical protein
VVGGGRTSPYPMSRDTIGGKHPRDVAMAWYLRARMNRVRSRRQHALIGRRPLNFMSNPKLEKEAKAGTPPVKSNGQMAALVDREKAASEMYARLLEPIRYLFLAHGAALAVSISTLKDLKRRLNSQTRRPSGWLVRNRLRRSCYRLYHYCST